MKPFSEQMVKSNSAFAAIFIQNEIKSVKIILISKTSHPTCHRKLSTVKCHKYKRFSLFPSSEQ